MGRAKPLCYSGPPFDDALVASQSEGLADIPPLQALEKLERLASEDYDGFSA
jgi:hypothetical protein